MEMFQNVKGTPDEMYCLYGACYYSHNILLIDSLFDKVHHFIKSLNQRLWQSETETQVESK